MQVLSTEEDVIRTLYLEKTQERILGGSVLSPGRSSYFVCSSAETPSHGFKSAILRLVPHEPAEPRDEDFDWFYSDPARVSRYAGQFVAVSNRRVVGHGTALEAANQSLDDSLVFYVESPEDREVGTLGL